MFACRLLGITLAVEMFGMTYNSYVVKWPRETPMMIPGPKFFLKLNTFAWESQGAMSKTSFYF